MPSQHKAKLTTQEMIAMRQQGLTLDVIAAKAGVSRQAVQQRLSKETGRDEYHATRRRHRHEAFVALAAAGAYADDVARTFCISVNAVRKYAARHGIAIAAKPHPRPREGDAYYIRRLMDEGLSLTDAAAKVGLDCQNAWKLLDYYKLTDADLGRKRKNKTYSRETVEAMHARLVDGLTLKQVGQEVDVHPHMVLKLLGRYGITHPRPRAGRNQKQ